MEADRPEIKDDFSLMDNETYDNPPLTRWLDKSGKPIEDQYDAVNNQLGSLETRMVTMRRDQARQ